MRYQKTGQILFYGLLMLIIVSFSHSPSLQAQDKADPFSATSDPERTNMPPLIERYLIEELKNIRNEFYQHRIDIVREVANRQVDAITVTQKNAISIVNYFFYMITSVVTILAVLGWNSLRDIKRNAKAFANSELKRLVDVYEKRLEDVEQEIHNKSLAISKNYELLRKSNEKNAIWLKLHMESNPKNKIELLDELLASDRSDVEALAYKADAALLLHESTWALSLSNTALAIDPNHAHAIYQKACAYAQLEDQRLALRYLDEAIKFSPSFRRNARDEVDFEQLRELEEFKAMVRTSEERNKEGKPE